MSKRIGTTDTAQVISLVSSTGVSLPQINQEHAAFLKANPPDDFIEDIGNLEYKLVRVKLDSKTFETVGIYEIAVPDGYREITVYSCECRLRDNQIFRCEIETVTMCKDVYEETRKTRR